MEKVISDAIENDRIILFDGVCKLCSAWSKFLIKYDKSHEFKLCSVQSAEGKAILDYFGYPEDYCETMLLVDGAKSFEKSEAFFKVMNGLGWPWKAITIFKVLPLNIRDWLYDRIALNRYALFGKYEYCLFPSADHNGRFLDGS
jgi:predicted DCC family thiol-disulfide oxidoreductase YuxK